MNVRIKVTVAVVALVVLTILSITMLLTGQTVTAVVTLIPSIGFGVQQIVSAVNSPASAAGNRPPGTPPIAPGDAGDTVGEGSGATSEVDGVRPT